jgi:hypothetical protein
MKGESSPGKLTLSTPIGGDGKAGYSNLAVQEYSIVLSKNCNKLPVNTLKNLPAVRSTGSLEKLRLTRDRDWEGCILRGLLFQHGDCLLNQFRMFIGNVLLFRWIVDEIVSLPRADFLR